VQGRALRGLVFFIVTAVIWVITFGLGGWIGHLWACDDAAVWRARKPERGPPPRYRRP
jgi:hypothetical protein